MLQPQFVPNIPLQVAAALRYINANGDLVTQLYPNDYLSLVGSAAGDLTTQYQQVNQILATYASTLQSLQVQITAIQTSGTASLPQVNGQCFSGNTAMDIGAAVTALISSQCSYNSVLGTPTALAQSILAQCTGLNTAPAFSQNSAMAGLSGWKSSISTIADAVNNLEVSYCDSRAGISKALAAVTPTCAQVMVDFRAVYTSSTVGFNLYFNGYSFIPTGFIDAGSSIHMTDGEGNSYTTTVNVVTQSTSSTPFFIPISGSTLSPNSASYRVELTSILTNSSIPLTCNKTTIRDIGGSTSSISGYTIGNYTGTVTSGTTTIPIATGLGYTPRFVSWVHKTSASAIALPYTVGLYMSYGSGTASINLSSGQGVSGTVNIDYITYK